MRKIRLANDSEYEISRCGVSQNQTLWIGFPAGVMTILEAATVFSDKTALQTIKSFYDFGMEETFEGFTKLTVVQYDYDGNTLVALGHEP